MANSNGGFVSNSITPEKIQAFADYLIGQRIPEGFIVKKPRLSKVRAERVLDYLKQAGYLPGNPDANPIPLIEISLEDADHFYRFLQGEGARPDDRHVPRLSSRVAFSVIYILQEFLRVMPDTFERCKTCGDLFDRMEGVGRGEHCPAHDYLD